MGNIANIIHTECSHMQKDCVNRLRKIKSAMTATTKEANETLSLNKIVCIHICLIMDECMHGNTGTEFEADLLGCVL